LGKRLGKFPALRPHDPSLSELSLSELSLPELSLPELSLPELKRSELKPLAKLHGLKLPACKFLVSKNQLPICEQQKKK
jgi:hypothetical protein